MTRGPWRYQKSRGHHHVLFPNGEVLDVQNEADARAIAKLPKTLEELKYAKRQVQILGRVIAFLKKNSSCSI